MDRFLRGPPKRTDAIQTACVEICESKYDRLLLSVIDTPGLDFQEGHELKLERQVSTVVKYLDAQFADTLSEVRVSLVLCGCRLPFLLYSPSCEPVKTYDVSLSVRSNSQTIPYPFPKSIYRTLDSSKSTLTIWVMSEASSPSSAFP